MAKKHHRGPVLLFWLDLVLPGLNQDQAQQQKEIGVFRREYPTMQETGYLTQAEWQARYGGSQLDYEDWLRGQ